MVRLERGQHVLAARAIDLERVQRRAEAATRRRTRSRAVEVGLAVARRARELRRGARGGDDRGGGGVQRLEARQQELDLGHHVGVGGARQPAVQLRHEVARDAQEAGRAVDVGPGRRALGLTVRHQAQERQRQQRARHRRLRLGRRGERAQPRRIALGEGLARDRHQVGLGARVDEAQPVEQHAARLRQRHAVARAVRQLRARAHQPERRPARRRQVVVHHADDAGDLERQLLPGSGGRHLLQVELLLATLRSPSQKRDRDLPVAIHRTTASTRGSPSPR